MSDFDTTDPAGRQPRYERTWCRAADVPDVRAEIAAAINSGADVVQIDVRRWEVSSLRRTQQKRRVTYNE